MRVEEKEMPLTAKKTFTTANGSLKPYTAKGKCPVVFVAVVDHGATAQWFGRIFQKHSCHLCNLHHKDRVDDFDPLNICMRES
jgi:hypothetical protein